MSFDYNLSNDDPANSETFNKRFGDINARLKQLEKADSALNEAREEIIKLGLARINPIVAEALATIENVSELADLFRAHSSSSVEIGIGVHELIISESDRSLFAAPLYVAISVDGQLEPWMTGQVQSWNKETGQLFVDVTHIKGEGTFDDWVVTPTHIPGQGPTLDAYTKAETDTAVAQAKSEAKAELLGGVGAAFDTLKELSDARGENVDAITALAGTVGQKADSSALKALAFRDTVSSSYIDPKSISNEHWVDNAENIPTGNWDDVVTNGFWMGSSTTNNPLGSDTRWWIGQVVAHNSSYVTQELWDFTVSNPTSYRRYRKNGTWQSWERVDKIIASGRLMPVAGAYLISSKGIGPLVDNGTGVFYLPFLTTQSGNYQVYVSQQGHDHIHTHLYRANACALTTSGFKIRTGYTDSGNQFASDHGKEVAFMVVRDD